VTIRVISLDDHYLIREGIRRRIDEHQDVELTAEGTTGAELYPLVAQYRPDIVLLDLGMPQTAQEATPEHVSEFSAFPVVTRLRADYPDTRVIVLSQYGTRTLIESALDAGVKGYLLKSDALMQNLVEAIRIVHRGGVYFSEAIVKKLTESTPRQPSLALTNRHREIMRAIVAHPDRLQMEHAQHLGISEYTLKQHLGQIYRVLGVSNLTAAILKAIQLKVIPLAYVLPVDDEQASDPKNGPS
jgi:DNA-binding NarL/FixJ family response regulator